MRLDLELTHLKLLKSIFERQLDFSILSGVRAGTINDDLSAGLLVRHPSYNAAILKEFQVIILRSPGSYCVILRYGNPFH
ncbi:MAG: hypothetical protein HGA23_10390 [Bacteroidales bacterium]|nr:hypothetical protein [Bacteroidales bacterium]